MISGTDKGGTRTRMAEFMMVSMSTMNPMEAEFRWLQMALYCTMAVGQRVRSLDHECVSIEHGFH
jgi:hypothetical protein